MITDKKKTLKPHNTLIRKSLKETGLKKKSSSPKMQMKTFSVSMFKTTKEPIALLTEIF